MGVHLSLLARDPHSAPHFSRPLAGGPKVWGNPTAGQCGMANTAEEGMRRKEKKRCGHNGTGKGRKGGGRGNE